MVNEDKVKLMTKLATYEKKEGKETLPIMQYYQDDYIVYHVMKTAISATIAYVLILAAVCVAKSQYLLENIHKMTVGQIGGRVFIGYLIMLAVYITAGLIFYIKKYENARDSVKRYLHWLKQLNSFYKEQEEEDDL